jgi:hypothetical protein
MDKFSGDELTWMAKFLHQLPQVRQELQIWTGRPIAGTFRRNEP